MLIVQDDGGCDERLNAVIAVVRWCGGAEFTVGDRARLGTHVHPAGHALGVRLLCYTSCAQGCIYMLVMEPICGLWSGLI